MVIAVGGLLPMESPPGHLPTTLDLAPCSEVNSRAAHDLALMAIAYSGRTIGLQTPRLPPSAGAIRATPAVIVNHAVFSMFLAINRCLAAIGTETRSRRAGCMRATPGQNVHHAVLSMLLAVCSFAALYVECWLPCAGVVRAASATNVYHVILSMLPAVQARLTLPEIIVWPLRAGFMCATPALGGYHAVLSMCLAENRRLAACLLYTSPSPRD